MTWAQSSGSASSGSCSGLTSSTPVSSSRCAARLARHTWPVSSSMQQPVVHRLDQPGQALLLDARGPLGVALAR